VRARSEKPVLGGAPRADAKEDSAEARIWNAIAIQPNGVAPRVFPVLSFGNRTHVIIEENLKRHAKCCAPQSCRRKIQFANLVCVTSTQDRGTLDAPRRSADRE